MKLTVGATPVQLPYKGNVTPLLQNLGPGKVYFDNSPTVTTSTGIEMVVGAVYEWPGDLGGGGGIVWLVSDGTSDVRVAKVA